MVGFTLLSRSYYYLRRRSPGPPFPPDHRQAGERGAKNRLAVELEGRFFEYALGHCVDVTWLLPSLSPRGFSQAEG